MATPGSAVAAPIFNQTSLTPLVERVQRTLDLRGYRERQEKEAINQRFSDEISSIDYTGLTTDQIDGLKKRTNALVDLNAQMIKNAGGDPRKIDQKAILKEQNTIRALGDRWRKFDSEISTVNKAVELDKYNVYDKEAVRNALIGMTYETGPSGERKPREDVNTGEAIAILENSAFMDPDRFVKREIDKLDEVTTKEFETQSGIPGFGTLGFTTQQKTRVPWQLDASGQPKLNPDTGEKTLDLDNWAQIVLDDPNTRKHIQHFAAQDGVTVNEWLHRKALKHNATPKTIERILMPRVDTASVRRSREAEDVKKVFLDTISGLVNQSPDLVRNLPQADELDEENVPYRDATEILKPYALTKVNGRSSPLAKVYIKDGDPGQIYVKETENSELRKISDAEVTNMINAAGTLNTALRGIDSYALQRGYVTGQNVFNPDVNIMRDTAFLQERGQMREQIIKTRVEDQNKLKDIATTVKEKWGINFMGGDQRKLANEINTVLQGKTIRVPGRLGTTKTVTNPTVEVDVQLFGANQISIKDNGETVATMPAKDFAKLIESENFIVREPSTTEIPEQEPIPEPEETFPLDTLGQ